MASHYISKEQGQNKWNLAQKTMTGSGLSKKTVQTTIHIKFLDGKELPPNQHIQVLTVLAHMYGSSSYDLCSKEHIK